MTALKYHEIIDRMTLEDKVALCSGADFWTTKAFSQYGIPSIFMCDGPHGLRKQKGGEDTPGADLSVPATCFPTACATACSWDRQLLHSMGAALAEEALQEGSSIVLGPGVNIKRNPLCGRNFEYFSEDPFLAGEMAASWINGVQSKAVGVSLKHFAVNNQENLRMVSDSIVDERTLREIYLPAFETAVKKARPATIMCAYNRLNGVYCSDNAYLLDDILRQEWGYEGVIVSDWGAMNDRVKAFEASLDLEMPGGFSYFDRDVIDAVKNGQLAEKVVDESVDRLLNLIFNGHKNRQTDFRYDVNAHHEFARQIAAQSAVLLKNDDHTLPIHKGQKIALMGALAREPRYQGAGSSFINPTRLSSAVDGFEAHALPYTFFPGYDLNGKDNEALIQEAVSGARACDIAVIFAGLTADYESEGFDRATMGIPPAQVELITQVAHVNPNTVVVLAGGAPMEMPWLPVVKAVLHMHLAGQAGGLAAADLLTGAVNPSGKLAESYPFRYEDVPSAGFYEEGGKQAQYREGLYMGYRYYDKAKKAVAFPFGYGLSYTTFEYKDLVLSRAEINDSFELTVQATVCNRGAVDGAEVVQIYVSSLEQGMYRPEKELKEFTKVFLKAGEEKQVMFHLNYRSFACYDAGEKTWFVPDGRYVILVGASSRDIRLQQEVRVHGKSPEAITTKTAWYANPSGRVSQDDFEQLLGHKIEALKKPKKGEFTMSSILQDMTGSIIIRIVIFFLKREIARRYGRADANDPNYKMMVESFVTTPMKSLISMSGGAVPANMAQGLVHAANGRLLKSIGSFLNLA